MNRKQRRRSDRRSEIKIRNERLLLEKAKASAIKAAAPTGEPKLLLPGVWAAIGRDSRYAFGDVYGASLKFRPQELMGAGIAASRDPFCNVSATARMLAEDISRKIYQALIQHGGFN